MWIYSLYEIMKKIYNSNNINDKQNITFVSMLYFLGLLEWFHLLIIDLMYHSLKTGKRCVMMFGEEIKTELETMNEYTLKDFRDYFSYEYCSHSTLYLIDDDCLTLFNPDINDNDCHNDDHNELTNKLCLFLNKKFIPIDINDSIQTLLDDQYCIFHCMNFMLKLVDIIDTTNNIYSPKNQLSRFMKYIESLNKITKKSDIHTFIQDLYLKSGLYFDLLEKM